MQQLLNDEEKLFDWICRIEPPVSALYDEVKRVKDDGGSYFCASELWYWGGDPRSKDRKQSFKKRMWELVGEGRRPSTSDAPNEAFLASSEAYDIVYQTLYNALPDCRGCSCIAIGGMIYTELYQRRLKG